jgi:putative membrane protein
MPIRRHSLPQVVRQWLRLSRLEWRLAADTHRSRLALVVAALVPALYLLIYLSGVWNPTSYTQSLKVGLVDQDRGHSYRNVHVNIGEELTNRLFQKKTFGFIHVESPELARAMVRRNDLAFAVIIPTDFSSQALPGLSANEGLLEIYTSAGNNYQTHLMAKKFAVDLDTELNQTLNEQRWKFVLTSPEANEDWQQLRSALAQINQGSKTLSHGLSEAAKASNRLQSSSARLGDEVVRLANGAQQMGQALRTVESSLPPADDVRRLRQGAVELAAAHAELDKGLGQLSAGSQQLVTGLKGFRQNQENSFWVGPSLSEWIVPFDTGLNELNSGLQKAHESQLQMKAGSEKLSESVTAVAYGIRELRSNLRQNNSKLPEASQLNQLGASAQELAQAQKQLDQGLRQLQEGGVYLKSSTDWLVSKLPSQFRLIEGSPEGLAHSVASEVKVVAPVNHLGAALIPNIIPLAIWLGSGVALFLIRGRHVPLFARAYASWVKCLGKATIPALVVTLQSLLVVLLLWLGFDVEFKQWLAEILMIVMAANAFMLVFLLFVLWGGDVGKALAMLFLALQLSASGGIVPIELSGQFYAVVSPWLPMTWVVQGLKATQFGAFESNWLQPFMLTLALGLTCMVLSAHVAKWRYGLMRELKPSLDI